MGHVREVWRVNVLGGFRDGGGEGAHNQKPTCRKLTTPTNTCKGPYMALCNPLNGFISQNTRSFAYLFVGCLRPIQRTQVHEIAKKDKFQQ